MSFPLVQLGDVCDIAMGQAPAGETYNIECLGVPLIAGAGDFGEVSPTASKFTTAPTKISKIGDIILCIRATIGDRNWSDISYCLGRGVAGLSAMPSRLDQNYLWQWLAHAAPSLKAKGRGATFLQVNKTDISTLEIPLPPIEEQRRIAAILDKADALRAQRRAAIAKLDKLLQSVFIEMFGDPVKNPKGFPRKKLGEIIKFEGGAQPPASTFSNENGAEKIRLVQIRDFKTDKFITYIPRSMAKRFFEKDDVMIGRYGPPVFQIFRGLSGSYNVALMKAVPRDGITKDFIFHLLQEKNLHNFVVVNSERTAGQSGVNLDLLEAYEAYSPPWDLQQRFADISRKIEFQRAAMRVVLEKTENLFSSLQQCAFSGKL